MNGFFFFYSLIYFVIGLIMWLIMVLFEPALRPFRQKYHHELPVGLLSFFVCLTLWWVLLSVKVSEIWPRLTRKFYGK